MSLADGLLTGGETFWTMGCEGVYVCMDLRTMAEALQSYGGRKRQNPAERGRQGLGIGPCGFVFPSPQRKGIPAV